MKEFHQLRYVVDQLTFCTPMGRERLLDSSFLTKPAMLQKEYDKLESILPLLGSNYLSNFKNILCLFRDIKGTIDRLNNGFILNEIELFEVKYFAYHINKLRNLESKSKISIENLSKVFAILDPNDSGVVNFYIYDCYDPELALLRKKEREEEVYIAIARREEVVCERLSKELLPFGALLAKTIQRVAEVDLLIAKCDFFEKYNLTRPVISEKYGNTSYKNLFNIYLMDIAKERYQKIDVDLIAAPTVITGANMSGKTMLLKSVALAQYMIQFGFYAPASHCVVSLVEDIFISIGDNQKEEEGLSSYAAEILKVSDIMDHIYKKGNYLVLLDELARTTSPIEGAAIVDATTTLLQEKGVMSLITTHYSFLQSDVRCKRVKGFVENKMNGNVTKNNITQYIDYSLVDSSTKGRKQSEAIRIAEILGVNKKLIKKTKEFINE